MLLQLLLGVNHSLQLLFLKLHHIHQGLGLCQLLLGVIYSDCPHLLLVRHDIQQSTGTVYPPACPLSRKS